ncbi:MAG: YibE/F family protein [Bacillati bacterium ANGP1]|uniref:YibE/F family protein n=1 Tax=Candidatus Segetimicrobium genomatis TaxID=2569760 RepID=A0A537LF95_9BACT|nr:MAG: YibE/F family protein [Terrabacteria group bacterium ANGP1]
MTSVRSFRVVIGTLLVAALTLGWAHAVPAQEPTPSPLPPFTESVPPDQFFRGKVVEIIGERVGEVVGSPQLQQIVLVEIATAGGSRERVRAEFSAVVAGGAGQALRPGDAVIVVKSPPPDQTYFVADRDRSRPLAFIAAVFVALAVLLGRLRGVTSLVGLGITVVVLAEFVVPGILSGASPLLVSVLGALVIAVASIYLAHGFSRRTSIAVASTLITLTLSAFLAAAAVSVARLFGSGTEEAFYLQLGLLKQVNLRGLLLGGIILGAVGVLDDITTGQAAAVDEIHKANPALPVRELYQRGRSVGTEHITSLVNTLFLAYAGASLPLFILFTINTYQPLWVTLSSEFVAEEIVRTLVGSIALILAVPITTQMAAYVLGRGVGQVRP